jgi:hypothetical protein
MAEYQNHDQQDRGENQRHQRQFMEAAIKPLVGKIESQRDKKAQDAQLKITHVSSC